MSRLAGARGRFATPRSVHVERMLGALVRPGWRVALAEQRETALGLTGWRDLALHEDGGLMVALEGMVYNRTELGAGDDVAVVAELYRDRGIEGVLAALNGDFALAVADLHRDELHLARDRFGVKPLYWTELDEGTVFASQPGALVRLEGVPCEPDPAYVARIAAGHYRIFDNDETGSPYAGIHQLPAAHVLSFSAEGRSLQRYWQLEDAPDLDEAEHTLAERYRELLLDAVARRVARARSPLFTLSGGLDSASVLACAVQATGRKQQAVSAVYRDRTYDERAEIRSMLDAAVEQWHPVEIDRPDVLSLVSELVGIHDEPVATATWLSHELVCRYAAGQDFGALFGGLGGDELNAGEYEYFFPFFADLRLAGEESILEREIEAWKLHHDHPIFRKDRAVVEETLARTTDPSIPGRCLPDRRRLDRYAHVLAAGQPDLRAYEPVMDHPFTSYLKNRTWQDLGRETAPCCLRAEDRQTTAHGLDHFLPFLDHRLAELMFRVPAGYKIRDGTTKRLLREAMRGLLPEETRTRIAKTGWNAPAHIWFTTCELELVRDLVRSREFRERGIHDVAAVEALLDEHERIVESGEQRENHVMFIWQLVNVELWLRWVDRLRRAG